MDFNTKGLSREEIMSLARLLTRLGRNKDASVYATTAISVGFESSPDVQLSEKSRTLLSDVLNKRVQPMREAIRNVNALLVEQMLPQGACVPAERFESLQEEYRKVIVKELIETCTIVVDIVRDFLLPTAKDSEAKVFYNKMAGDFSRYIAENPERLAKETASNSSGTGSGLEEKAKEETEEFYNSAYRLAQTTLPPTHATRLGLEMNMAVFYYEIKRDPAKAIQFAKDTCDDALAELDEEEDETAENGSTTTGNRTKSTLKMLKENVELWEKAQGEEP